MLVLTYVYRIRPTRAQYRALDKILSDQRQLYNAALEERIAAWRRGIPVGLNDQTKSLTQIRSFDDAYSGVPYNVSKWTLKRLDDAMKAFFKRARAKVDKAGFPRFRGKGRWSSFGFHQRNGLRPKGSKLLFSGGLTGGLRIKMHRPLPDDAVLKSAVFTKEGEHWRVGLTVETASPDADSHPEAVCGVDVGIEALATLSDGQRFANPRIGKAKQRALRLASRALARCKRGSKRRRKVRAKLAAVQRSIRNARTTALHVISKEIAQRFALIAIEDLKLKNMTRSAKGTLAKPGVKVRQKAGLNRALADAAPGRLIKMLRYKAEKAGGRVIAIDPKGTSQACSACGVTVLKTLSQRRHICACGADLHRDHNAAINIKQRGVAAHEAARRLEGHNVTGHGVRALENADLQPA